MSGVRRSCGVTLKTSGQRKEAVVGERLATSDCATLLFCLDAQHIKHHLYLDFDTTKFFIDPDPRVLEHRHEVGPY